MADLPKQMSKTGILFLSLLVGFLLLAAVISALHVLLGPRFDGTLFAKALVVIWLLASLAVGITLIRRSGRGASRTGTAMPHEQPSIFAPPPEPEVAGEEENPVSGEVIVQARNRPIVFRQSFPPASDAGLSFHGGLPIGPATLEWPRHPVDDGTKPLSFVMQWDCRELAAQDVTGLLPHDGVLYFFADLNWGHKDAYRFVHASGDPAGWIEIAPPADLGPILRSETAWQVPWCNAEIAPERQDCPKLLPRWPFRPLAFSYPLCGYDEVDDSSRFWDENAAGKALVAVQDSLGAPLAAFGPGQAAPAPFPAFPHDWAAVRIVCSMVIDKLRQPSYSRLPDAIELLKGEAREARIAEWRGEAIEQYEFAARNPLNGAVPSDLSAQIRKWMDKVNGCFFYSQAIEKSVNASLGLRSQALGAIPQGLIARASRNHMLGQAYDRSEYRHEFNARCCAGLDQAASDAKWAEAQAAGTLPTIRQIHAPSPNRMFGPPSYVQGNAEELVEDHVLLLEISSSSHIGIELGEGVIQYMIRPADLAAGRFDRAEVIMSAY